MHGPGRGEGERGNAIPRVEPHQGRGCSILVGANPVHETVSVEEENEGGCTVGG